MSCEFEDDLSAYVDGELPEVRARAVKVHLHGCAECRGAEALIRRTAETMKAHAAEFEPSPQLRRAVLNAIDSDAGKSRLRGPLAWLVPLAGIAAVGALVFVVARGSDDVPDVVDEPELAELAMNLDAVEDLDVAALDDASDLEVITSLHQLENPR